MYVTMKVEVNTLAVTTLILSVSVLRIQPYSGPFAVDHPDPPSVCAPYSTLFWAVCR